MNRKRLRIIVALLLITSGVVVALRYGIGEAPITDVKQASQSKVAEDTNKRSFGFGNSTKSEHYQSNTPAHKTVLPGVPLNVVVDFESDLVVPSAMSIKFEDKEYSSNTTISEGNRKTMRRNMDPKAPDGLYQVNYRACISETNCTQGSFQFAIDRTLASTYTDMRGQKEVTIRIKDNKFNPSNVRVSKDTKVIWVNEDNTDHFVNADPHPTHSYLPGMNSASIVKGATYTFLFDITGYFPYHCNIHSDSMKGAVLAE